MKKAIRIPLLYLPLLFTALAVGGFFIGGPIYLKAKLEEGVRFGDIRIRGAGVTHNWDLALDMDTLYVTFPGGKTKWEGFHLSFYPLATDFKADAMLRIQAEAGWVDLQAAEPKPKKEASGPIPLPDIKIPFPVRVNLGELTLRRDDSLLVWGSGFQFQNTSRQKMSLNAGRLVSPLVRDTLPPVALQYDGRKTYWTGFRASVFKGKDSLLFSARVFKKDVRQHYLEGVFGVEDLKPYLPPGSWPDAIHLNGLTGTVRASQDSSLMLHLDVAGDLGELLMLPEQRVSVNAELREGLVSFSLDAEGPQNQVFRLYGKSEEAPLGSYRQLVENASRLAFQTRGYSRGLRWFLANRYLPMEFDLENGKLDSHGFSGRVKTPDGSDVVGSLTWKPELRAEFKGSVPSQESWIQAWVKGKVAFAGSQVDGVFQDGQLRIQSVMRDVKAYGAEADSLFTTNRVDAKGYYLEKSRLFYNDALWRVAGKVMWRGTQRGLDFSARHPDFGRANFAMRHFKHMSASVSALDLERAPYPLLKPLFAYHPKATGVFQWDYKGRAGELDVLADARWQGKAMTAAVEASWSQGKLSIPKALVRHYGEQIELNGEARLGDKAFYEVYKLRLPDVEGLRLKARDVRGGSWLPLVKVTAVKDFLWDGEMTFHPEEGFLGAYRIRNVALGSLDTLFSLPEMSIRGDKWSFDLEAQTLSEEWRHLNNQIFLEIVDVKDPQPEFSLKVTSSDTLTLLSSGRISHNKRLDAGYRLSGGVLFPQERGGISRLDIQGHVSLPLDSLKGISLDAFVKGGDLFYPPLDTLQMKFPLQYRDGEWLVRDMEIKNIKDESLRGSFVYSLPDRTGRGEFSGLAWSVLFPGNQHLTLRDFRAILEVDSQSLVINGDFNNNEFRYEKGKLKVQSDIPLAQVHFEAPLMGKRSLRRNSLEARVQVEDFLLTHNIYHNVYQSISRGRFLPDFSKLLRISRKSRESGGGGRERPVEVQITAITRGGNNRVRTDYLRAYLEGEISVKGTYPLLLAQGEFSVTRGSFGREGQAYNVSDMDLSWNNVPLEDGRISMRAEKWIAADCYSYRPDSCQLGINLQGELQHLEFSYDGTCGGELGEDIKPLALISAAGKGCFNVSEVSGTHAVMQLLEGELNQLSRDLIAKNVRGIENLRVRGLSNMVAGEEETVSPQVDEHINSSNPDAVTMEVESQEVKRVRLKAASGWLPDSDELEMEAGVEWHPPLEHLSKNSTWDHRVKRRFKLEAKVKSGPSAGTLRDEEEDREVRYRLGVNYNYEFWEIW